MAIAAEHDRSRNRHGKAKAHAGSQTAAVWTDVEFQQLDFGLGQTAMLAFGDYIAHDSGVRVFAPSCVARRAIRGAAFPICEQGRRADHRPPRHTQGRE